MGCQAFFQKVSICRRCWWPSDAHASQFGKGELVDAERLAALSDDGSYLLLVHSAL